MKKLSKVLLFNEFLNEDYGTSGASSAKTPIAPTSANNLTEIKRKGFEFTKNLKKLDDPKPEWKHLPCYQYVYEYIKQYKPTLNVAIINDFKMAYKKDINTLLSKEALDLSRNSLQVPTQPETMRGLEYANSKYKIGTIVPIDQAKPGDAISFWVYEFIEFSRIQKNYSYPDTGTKFANWAKLNKVDVNKLPEWLIEGVSLKYGHYGIISEIDDKYIYLSSSGEKRGCNGIWNGVPKTECSDNFTKILKDDLRKFQNMSYDKLQFQSTDTLSNKRTQLVMRSYILNFIK